MKTKILLLLTIAPFLLAGCASILDGGPKSVQITSNPEGAKITISDKDGKEIDVEKTPTIVSLEREHGYLDPENYKLVFEAPGYYPYEIHVKSTLDGWYLGNVFFGGLIGLIIVDPATGDMFTLWPRNVNCNLVSSAVPLTPEELREAELRANPDPTRAINRASIPSSSTNLFDNSVTNPPSQTNKK